MQTTNENNEIVFVWSPGRGGRALWFSESGGGYIPKYGARQTLVQDSGVWRITDPDGTVWEFDVSDGLISKQIAPGGQETVYMKSGGRIAEKRRTEGTNVESRVFAYTDGNLTSVTLYRGTTSDPHDYAVRRAVFTYYTSTDPGKGNTDDLKTVTDQILSGVSWVDVATRYFRYYTADTGTTYTRALKYVVGPAGYAKLVEAGNPFTASDGDVEAVAEKSFQEYDPTTRRVTLVVTHGGTQTFDIEYTTPTPPNSIDFNHWQLKAVATLPDLSTKTVFANHISRDMLVDHDSGSKQWIRYTRFNEENGRTELQAEPSAIDMDASPIYDESAADLDVELHEDAGLIRRFTYYESTDLPNGEVEGYLNEQQVQKGEGGSPISVSKLNYTSESVGSGPTAATVYPIAKQTVYRSTSGGGDPVETNYSYTWHSGTTQPATVTTALPDVDSGQNGGGWLTGNTRVQHFNIQGRLTKSVDARGVETTYDYDPVTGTVSQMIVDPGSSPHLNLVTDYVADEMGRNVETLAPAHDVDGYTARTVRWTLYLDSAHEVRTAQGYLIGSNYTLVNPVSISRMDKSGRITDQIEATRDSGVEDSGALSPADTFDQTTWTRWTHHEIGDDGRLEYTQVYHDIPTSGGGSSGTNFDKTDFGYDDMGRRNRVESPAGTIMWTVYEPRGLVLATWVGTDDTGASESDPGNGGASGNDMQPVTVNTYDTDAYGSGNDSRDGLLTKVTSPVDDDSGHDRVVDYRYDWRDRQTKAITTDGTHTFRAKNTYDNLDRVTCTTEHRVGSPDFLIAKAETAFDDRGRVFRTTRWGVNDEDEGETTNSLVDNTWFDQEGNVLKSLPAGSQMFTKNAYDNAGRRVATYQGYWSGSGDDTPLDVDDDVIFEQAETKYDAASSVIEVTSRARWQNASGLGPLEGPSGSEPKSRDSYVAAWYDGIGRQKATADYGTNNNAGPPTRPSTAPSSSATVLVSWTVHNARGEVEFMIDAATKTTRNAHDDAGRVKSVVRNYFGSPQEEVQTTYTPEGQVATLTAVNSDTGNQVTTYSYGVTLTNSHIASNSLLQQVTYPDAGVVEYEYNRQSQRIKLTDQNGTAHAYGYDKLARQISDAVTDIDPPVDESVLLITWSYDNRKRLHHVRSYDLVEDGDIVNDVEYLYNDFSQVIEERQQHGDVTSGSSPKVEYGYEDGTDNTIRRTSCTYPDGRVVNYLYFIESADKLSRVDGIEFDSATVVLYEYLGLNQVVVQNFPGLSNVVYTLAKGSGSNPYSGLDRFGRIIDLLWEQQV